jgi:hypothetical protein
MCDVNHNLFPKPGYLIDVATESIAAKVLFTRMINHHATVGLSIEQLRGLIDVNREYQEKLLALRIEFGKTTEALELKFGRVDDEAIASRQELMDRRVEIFRAEEELFFEYAARGHALLTDSQIAKVDQIYHAEKDETLGKLLASLNNAVGPEYSFQSKLLP